MARMEKNALVVEDDRLLSWSLLSSLSRWGFEVQPAFSGEEALARLDNACFDVILLDYQLPNLDGLEVARQARQKQPGAAIFLLTAFQLNELSIDRGLIDQYFNKPLDLNQLHLALTRVPGLGIGLADADVDSVPE